MKHPEQVPATRGDRQFPMGDIDEARKMETANAWFEMVDDFDANRFVNYVLYKARPTGLDSPIVETNHIAALDLCVRWDKNLEDKGKSAQLGLVVMRAFVTETRLLPKCEIDLTNEFDRMAKEQPSGAAGFGKRAIDSMRYSHPSIYTQTERLYEFSKRYLGALENDDNRDNFQAGMMLAYMESVVARLEGYAQLNNVKLNMTVGTIKELENREFEQLFSRESLAK